MHLFDPKYSKNSNILKFENILNASYSCDFKAEFLASLLQSHDPSEIILIFWFAAQKIFIIMLKTAE